MQLIAESFDLLRSVLGLEPGRDRRRLPRVERRRPRVVPDRDDRRRARATPTPTTGKPFVDVVDDAAEQKGTGRWTVQSALDLGVPDHRDRGGHVRPQPLGPHRAAPAARQVFSTTSEPRPSRSDRDGFVDDVRAALLRLQGRRLRAGLRPDRGRQPSEHGWDIDLGMMATIWRGGCIIRAQFLDRIREAYADEPDLTTLLTTPYFADAVTDGVDAWRRVVATAAQAGVPTPAFSLVAGLLRRPAPRAAARRADPGRCATTSARTPTGAPTGRARSTPRGPATTPSRRCHEHRPDQHEHRPDHNLAAPSGTFTIGGDLPVVRLGYGTMQLTGDGVWGEPDDRDGALRVLRRAVEIGVTFFDTADSYGPFVAEELLREALHPYADDVVIATKAGLTRQGPGVWTPVGQPGVPAPAVRAEPAPPRAGDDRPVPAAPHRPRGARRRPGGRARRSCRTRARSATSGSREVDVAQLAGGAADGDHRDRAEPVQPRQPRRRAAARPLRAARHRVHPVVPAGHRRAVAGRTARSPPPRSSTTPRRPSSRWPGCSSARR